MRLTTPNAIKDETTKPKLKKKVIYGPQPIYGYEYQPSYVGYATAAKSLISKFLLCWIILLIL